METFFSSGKEGEKVIKLAMEAGFQYTHTFFLLEFHGGPNQDYGASFIRMYRNRLTLLHLPNATG
ncbi:MAG: hypothetical protein JSU05_03975 [Bacteroidetes bacterium]|nr:hypothetical protein [Bacteroidota bacterium]